MFYLLYLLSSVPVPTTVTGSQEKFIVLGSIVMVPLVLLTAVTAILLLVMVQQRLRKKRQRKRPIPFTFPAKKVSVVSSVTDDNYDVVEISSNGFVNIVGSGGIEMHDNMAYEQSPELLQTEKSTTFRQKANTL